MKAKYQLQNKEEEQSLLNLSERKENTNVQKQSSYIKKLHKSANQNVGLVLFLIILLVVCTLITAHGTAVKRTSELSLNLIQKAKKTQAIKSFLLDRNSYQGYVLSNGLKVLLVQDPAAENAFAAIDVNVGHWEEPDAVPGLAHFLEHMKFISSETFPELNYFSNFLSQNGGYSNAYTSDLHTNYYFKVTSNSIEGSLKRFAHMFIDPVFKAEAVDKESSAVNSEYLFDLNNDSWKVQFLISLLARKEHPSSRFSIGNKQTLIENPKNNGVDILEELKRFHDHYYSANLMSLVIYSKHPHSQMEKHLSQFEKINTNGILLDENFGFPIDKQALPAFVKLQTISSQKYLYLMYELDSVYTLQSKRALEFFQYYMTSDNPNSFKVLLQKQGLAQDLGFSVYYDRPEFCIVTTVFQLTDIGFQQMSKIINQYQNYLQKIQSEGLVEEIFESRRALAKFSFDYQEKLGGDEKYVSQLASYLSRYGLAKVMSADYEYEDYDEPYMVSLLAGLLDFKNAFFVAAANEFGDLDQSAQLLDADTQFTRNDLYNLDYSKQSLTEDQLLSLQQTDTQLQSQFTLPSFNQFIPSTVQLVDLCASNSVNPKLVSNQFKTRFQDLQHTESEHQKFQTYEVSPKNCKQYQKIPHLTFLKENFEGWYRFETTKYQVPKVSFVAKIFKNLQTLPELSNQHILYSIFNSQIQTTMHQELDASYSFSISPNSNGVTIKMYGWSDKFDKVALSLLNNLKDFTFDEEEFVRAKEKTFKKAEEYYNLGPIQQSLNLALVNVLIENSYTVQDYISALKQVTFQSVSEASASNFQTTYTKSLLSGNLLPEESQQVFSKFSQLFQSATQKLEMETVSDLKGQSLVLRKYVEGNEKNINSAILNYFQAGKREIRQFTIMKLFATSLNNFMFTYLRTQRELGYAAFAKFVSHFCVDSFVIGVQGAQKSPDQIDPLIQDGVEEFYQQLLIQTDDQLENLKISLKAAISQDPASMFDMTEQMWDKIDLNNYQFEMRELMLKELPNIQKQDILQTYHQIFFTNKLSLQIYSKNLQIPEGVVEHHTDNFSLNTQIFDQNTKKSLTFIECLKE